tara:strand:- start:8038 stop:8874 length:837 start_codon:yes stop_codon:yes gene_type:complete
MIGATPVFLDINKDFNLNPDKLEKAITKNTKAVIAVSMFGACANLTKIKKICELKNIYLIEDAAQSFGAKHNDAMSCSFADISTTSFFPAKPLGCYGDGGAIFTNNDHLFKKIDAISKHGQNGRYNYIEVGLNSRLDTIQAAVLIEKLKIFEKEITTKNQVAKKYNDFLSSSNKIILPHIPNEKNRSVWAQYTIILDKSLADSREKLMGELKELNIPSALYYPQPLHLVSIYADSRSSLPITEDLSSRVLSLPMHAYLEDDEIEYICNNLLMLITKQK